MSDLEKALKAEGFDPWATISTTHPDLVAYLRRLLTRLKQHEATIAELGTALGEANGQRVKMIELAESLKSDLAAAHSTIQQQARELQEADEALIELFSAWIADDPFISDATTRAANKAKDRHTARAQQAEAKEEE